MRPVKKPAQNVNYNPPAFIKFTNPNAEKLCRLYNFKNVTPFQLPLGAALNILLQHAKNPNQDLIHPDITGFPLPFPLPPPRAQPEPLTKQEQKSLREAIEKNVTDIYKKAAAPLTQDLGEFCSYCETFLAGLLEVEHTVPKSQFPTYATDWQNFLLCCGPCNTAKGSTPTRTQAYPWTQPPLPLPPVIPAEDDYYTAIRTAHYMWPDLNATCWRDMPFCLWGKKQAGGWQIINPQYSFNINNTMILYDVVNHNVMASIQNGADNFGNPTFGIFEVALVLSPTANQRAQEMNQLIKLDNNVSNPAAGTYDRRVMNRTRVWFQALAEVKRLTSTNVPAVLYNFWTHLLMMAAVTGFYSVWVQVLNQFRPAGGPSLGTYFAQQSNAPMFYPNTNITQVP